MKKGYKTPAMGVAVFSIDDIITASGAPGPVPATYKTSDILESAGISDDISKAAIEFSNWR